MGGKKQRTQKRRKLKNEAVQSPTQLSSKSVTKLTTVTVEDSVIWTNSKIVIWINTNTVLSASDQALIKQPRR